MLVFNCTKAAAEFFTVTRQGKKYQTLSLRHTKPSQNPLSNLFFLMVWMLINTVVFNGNGYCIAYPLSAKSIFWQWTIKAASVLQSWQAKKAIFIPFSMRLTPC
ncbi:hypothetical protein [Vibrio sp. zbq_2]|uniref:hypothetical protein n=1 Tax=Vibrio sp. zbq_2 TaxID=3367238 RepID=UPI00370C499B